jgi:membrane associated rhomboid family serine protease
MLDDRHYMRPDGTPGRWRSFSITIWLMIVLVIAFAAQQIDIVYFGGRYLDDLVLSSASLTRGHVWQLLTFQFLHANGMHLFFNLVGLWFFARFMEARLGRGRFLALYFGSGVAGGLFFAILASIFPFHFGMALGASAGISGAFAAYTIMEPEGVILAYFLVPVRAKYLLYVYVAISLFFTIVPSSGVAYAAHLGGMAFGVAYVRWGLNPWRLAEWNPLRRKLRREEMIRAATISPGKLRRRARLQDTQELPSQEFISKQVDPILDKISAHGIQSLTDRERQILQAARAKMAKR